MKGLSVAIAISFTAQALLPTAVAGEEFYGIIESLPDDKIGTWMVGGRAFDVTAKTKLDEDDGPLVVGACADVETNDGVVEEIESEPLGKCKK